MARLVVARPRLEPERVLRARIKGGDGLSEPGDTVGLAFERGHTSLGFDVADCSPIQKSRTEVSSEERERQRKERREKETHYQ